MIWHLIGVNDLGVSLDYKVVIVVHFNEIRRRHCKCLSLSFATNMILLLSIVCLTLEITCKTPSQICRYLESYLSNSKNSLKTM